MFTERRSPSYSSPAAPPDEQRKQLDGNDKSPDAINWALDNSQKAVCPVSPYRLNARIAAQQGTFLVPLDPELSFEENLNGSLGGEGTLWHRISIDSTTRFLEEALKS